MTQTQPMNAAQAALYQRLQDFHLDDPTHVLGFTQHLMRSQGWAIAYTERAIAEYKKFAFLTIVAHHQVVPSDAVDQVWHAHILLTQSYWDEFCSQVLQQPLHHQPTQGGPAERAKFHQLYAETIASYRHFFGEPPTDLWPPAYQRFGADLTQQRLRRSDYWLISKRFPTWPRSPKLFLPLVALAGLVSGCEISRYRTLLRALPDPSLLDVGIFGTIAISLGLALRYWTRLPTQRSVMPTLSDEAIAYLLGGKERTFDLVITHLVHHGYLRPNVRDQTLGILKSLPDSASFLQKQVMRQVRRTPEIKALRNAVLPDTRIIRDRLVKEQLLISGLAAFWANSFWIFLLITFLGFFFHQLFLSILDTSSPQVLNQGIQIGMAWCTFGILSLCGWVPSGYTQWGSRVAEIIHHQHDVHSVTQSVAVHGTTTLSGGSLDDLKQMLDQAAAVEDGGGCGC